MAYHFVFECQCDKHIAVYRISQCNEVSLPDKNGKTKKKTETQRIEIFHRNSDFHPSHSLCVSIFLSRLCSSEYKLNVGWTDRFRLHERKEIGMHFVSVTFDLYGADDGDDDVTKRHLNASSNWIHRLWKLMAIFHILFYLHKFIAGITRR